MENLTEKKEKSPGGLDTLGWEMEGERVGSVLMHIQFKNKDSILTKSTQKCIAIEE